MIQIEWTKLNRMTLEEFYLSKLIDIFENLKYVEF